MIIILGLIIIYIYYYKSINLYRLQNNFINTYSRTQNSLTSLNLFLETFEKHDFQERANKIHQLYEDDCDNLGTNVRHILRTARLESNSHQLDKEFVELNSTIQQFIEGQNRLKRQAEIIFNPSKQPIEFSLDKLFLRCFSSISSAMELNIPDKEIWIDLQREKDGILLRIRDNGIGILKTSKISLRSFSK